MKKDTSLTFTAQRLRNLTTGRLHTEMGPIYQDLEAITGEPGIMTHMITRVNDAVKPWLKQYVTEPRFWNDLYDPSHEGEIVLPMPTPEERSEMFARFARMPNPLAGKEFVNIVLT